MQEFKLSPLMLFILLLLILIVASYYSSWAKNEGFSTTSDGNPFAELINYNKYYKNLVNLSGNFWYDPKNGNVYRITLNASGKIMGATIYDRSDVKYNCEFTATTADESDKPTSIITNKQVDSVVKCWIESDDISKIQLNYIAIGKKTYIITFDTTKVTNPDSKYEIKKMLYFEDNVNVKTVDLSSNNEVSLVSESIYKSTFDVGNGYDETYVIEPLYDSSRLVYQIMRTLKFDEKNGNLIVNVVDASATGTGTVTTAASTTAASTTAASTTAASTTRPASTGTSGFRNIEGFSATSPNAINIFKRKTTSTGIITTPTTDKSLTSTLDKTATAPFFVSDPVGQNTVMYWPNGETTLIAIFANARSEKLKVIPYGICAFMDVPESPTAPPQSKQEDNKEDEDNMMDNYTKWSQYMLKTEVVPPVCPACPSCNTGGGGLCMDCGGKGGCGTKSSDGKSLAVKDDGNNVADVKGPSSAAASLGKSAGGAITGTVDTAGNVVGGTVNTAANLVGGTVNAAANLVSGTIGTAADLLKSTGSGLTNLASNDIRRVGYNQSYQGPATGAAGAGAGVNGYNRNNTGIGMVDSVPIDIYSYNGALQSKGSDFRPLTANFSSFSK